MVTERTIINALIIGAAFLLVPFLVSESLVVDYLPALCTGGLVALVLAFFFFKENLAVCPLIFASFQGALNFLPLPLTATHIFCILLILYYVTGYVIIRQRRIKLGSTLFLWPILILTAIVLYHNHSLNLGALGGTSEGAKPAILIYMVVVAYFCGINLPTPSVEVLSKIPFYALLATAISSLPYLITTWVPGLAPYLYMVTDSVNVESYVDSVSNGAAGAGVMGKLAAFGPVGSSLQVYLLAHYPVGTWFRPDRWWVAWLSIFCMVLVACSGYRSDMFGYFFIILVGAWCYYSWRSVILPAAVLIAILVVLIAGSNNVINLPVRKLPMITQRTLSFLPGDWDPDAIESGKGSDKFRDDIRDIYIKEYMDKNPLIGNGFTIDTKEFTYWNDLLNAGGGSDKDYVQAKTFIEGKMYHTGWISLYDCVGILGSMAFLAFGINEVRLNARFLFGPKADRRSTLFPLYVWLFCNIVTGLVSYFTVFGAFNFEFIGLLVFAIVLSHLNDLARKTEVPIIPGEIKGHVEMPRISGAYYGRR